MFGLKKIFSIIFLILSISIFAEPVKTNHSIYVLSFNVLAPCWASPDYYPPGAASYLARELRRKHIIDFLNSVADKADIITLQETTQIEFGFFKQALQDRFYGFQAYHDPQYWSNWITKNPPWEPNGVAIFVKKTTFTNVNFLDLPLTTDGNHSAYFEGIQKSTGLKVRAASVHLDNEKGLNRHRELSTIFQFMIPEVLTRDIVAGDFNYATRKGFLKRDIDKYNFKDTLQYLNREEWTTPFYENGDVNSGILDHIVVRNTLPTDGQVFNFNLWKLYPNESERIIANLQISGSDHFPIFSVIE